MRQIADYEAVKAPYHEVEVQTSDDFGAAAMTRRDVPAVGTKGLAAAESTRS
jgi:hypothetical protein